MDHAARGAAAISSGDFSTAINHYNDAIHYNPGAVKYYIERAKASTRLSPPNYHSSLKDAETAVTLAFKRQNKELILDSQLRRAIALFGLERYGDSKKCLEWINAKLNADDKKNKEVGKMVPIWEMKVNAKLKGLEEGDEKQTVSVQENPNAEVSIPATAKNSAENKGTEIAKPVAPASSSQNTASKNTETSPTLAKPVAPLPDPNKIRWEWYQNDESVTVSLYAKGIPKDKAHVEIKERSLDVSFPLTTGSDYDFSLDPLLHPVDDTLSTYKIMSTKVEFTLVKLTPGQKWATVEGSEPITSCNIGDGKDPAEDPIKRTLLAPTANNTTPAYPTSSKTGPKNWDKVVDDLTKRPKKEEKSGEGSDEEEDPGMEEEGDPTTNFFKKLYAGADPDTRRAMMKSYSESNGTALSTNWADVGKGPVETSPPDGMEAKKWGQ